MTSASTAIAVVVGLAGGRCAEPEIEFRVIGDVEIRQDYRQWIGRCGFNAEQLRLSRASPSAIVSRASRQCRQARLVQHEVVAADGAVETLRP